MARGHRQHRQAREHVEGHGHRPAQFGADFGVVDDHAVLGVVKLGRGRGDAKGGADQDVMARQDLADGGIGGGNHLQRLHIILRGRHPALFGKGADIGRHLLGVIVQKARDIAAEDMGEIGHTGRHHLGSPAGFHLGHRGAQIAEHLHRGQRVGAHIGVNLEHAKVQRIGDLPALDRAALQRQGQLGPQAGDVAGMRPRDDVLQQRRVAHRAGHRAGVAEEIKVEGRIINVAAVGRFEPHHPAGRSRDADRPADVRPHRQGRGARRQRGRRSARGAAGRERGVPRVAGDAPKPAPADAGGGKFGRGGAGMDDAARRQNALVVDRGTGGNVILEDQRARRGRLARNFVFILDPDGQPFQRAGALTFGVFCLGLTGAVHRLVEMGEGKGVDGVFHRLGPGDNRLHQLHRRQGFRAEPRQSLMRGQVAQIKISHFGPPVLRTRYWGQSHR